MVDIAMFFKDEDAKSYFKWINVENREFLEGMLHSLIEKESDSKSLEAIGKSIYERKISFSKLAIFLDTFSYKLSLEEKERLRKHENIVASGYLKERLPREIKSLKLGINNNPNFVTKKDLAIVDELLVWLEELIRSFLYKEKSPEIDERIEKFIKFAQERSGIFFEDRDVKEDFLRTNKELYECALEAVNFFEREQYFHFLLIYIEMIALFLKMVTLMSGMFLEEELLSIYIDPITTLPNRLQLVRDIESFSSVYIMIVNVKSFSKLNVLYGYDFGDTILKKIATFLKTSIAIKSYRIYGDEFAILIKDEERAKELFKELNSSISVHAYSTKYDIFFYGAYDTFKLKALESCEFALVRGDKKTLINSEEIKDMIHTLKKELTLTQKLKEIMINDAIIPYYQPIYTTDKRVRRVLKYEVLMRLEHDGETLAPSEFLDTLLETPFYNEFTKTILIKSFEKFKNSDMTFSVNFTLRDIKDKSVKLLLETLISKYPDVAKRLTIEIVENEALEEFELINEFIQIYKKRGVHFALDDFGSGYANFAQFAKIDIDFLKIDGTIISAILEDEKMQKLLESIIKFAKTLELQTIAEFVSTKELFEYLQDKVDMIQGYYVGKPEPILLEE